jgi:dihydrofolate reductase
MTLKKIYGIIACDPKGTMGKKGKLPWYCPEDLAHFSNTTHNNIIVMGHRTFLSLPKAYFDHRMGIVFTRQKHTTNENPNLLFIDSLESFIKLKHLPKAKDCYVIGGAEICKLFLQKNLIQQLLLTQFNKHYEGDVFFPLSLIRSWPYQIIQQSNAFTIYRYFNPVEMTPCR